MNKRVLLKNLTKAAEWISSKQRDHDEAVNTMTGCFGILNQAGQRGMADWLDRKPDRRRVLGNVREKYLTAKGNKVLRDLVSLTVAAVESCTWVDDWLPGALPMPVPQKKLSKRHKEALMRGARKNKGKMLEKLRLERKTYFGYGHPFWSQKKCCFPRGLEGLWRDISDIQAEIERRFAGDVFWWHIVLYKML